MGQFTMQQLMARICIFAIRFSQQKAHDGCSTKLLTKQLLPQLLSSARNNGQGTLPAHACGQTPRNY